MGLRCPIYILPPHLDLSNREWSLNIMVIEGQRLEMKLEVQISEWRKPSFWASQSFGAQSFCSCLRYYGAGPLQGKKIASSSRHLSVAVLSNNLFPVLSTCFATSEKDRNPKFLLPYCLQSFLEASFAPGSLRRVNAKRCMWARPHLMIHLFL